MTDQPVNRVSGAPWTMILAPKGGGKTRTAATLKDGFCFDTEPPGAASAWPENRRKSYNYEASMFSDLHNDVKALKKEGKRVERGIEYKGMFIGGVVLDTFDMLQQVLVGRYLQQKADGKYGTPPWVKQKMAEPGGFIWTPRMERQDWGTILTYQKPLLMDLKSLNIPVVITCHTKVIDPLLEIRGESEVICKQRGYRKPDVSGAIEDYILYLCDYVLNIIIGEDGTRRMYTQPTVVDFFEITAADRHRLFKNESHDLTSFPLTVGKDGNPDRKVLDYIVSNHSF